VVLGVQDSRLLRPLTRALPGFLQRQRWFAGKAKRVRACDALDIIPVRSEPAPLYFFLVQVEFVGSDPQTYALPLQELSNIPQEEAAEAAGFGLRITPERDGEDVNSVVFVDALRQQDGAGVLLDLIARGDRFRGLSGELVGIPTTAFQRLRGPDCHLGSAVLSVEQSNTSVVFEGRLILKMFRLVDAGINPEIEVCSFLTERTSFANFAALGGSLEYRQPGKAPMSLAALQAFVPNQGDAWEFTLGAVGGFFDRLPRSTANNAASPKPLLTLIQEETPPAERDLIGSYLDSAKLLGHRTAELHLLRSPSRSRTSSLCMLR
jgi:trehalose synthase-fused probable maltokinase